MKKLRKDLANLDVYKAEIADGTLGPLALDFKQRLVATLEKTHLPNHCETEEEIFELASNPKAIFQIVNWVKVKFYPQPIIDAVKDSQASVKKVFGTSEAEEKEFKTIAELISFAKAQQARLDHWYLWNGRSKAEAIGKAVTTLEAWKKEDDLAKNLPVVAARESGLEKALAIHRHSFFSHSAKTKAQEQLQEQCASLKAGL